MIEHGHLRTSFRLWALDSVALGHKLNPLAVTLLDRLAAQGLFEAAVLAVQLFEEGWLPTSQRQNVDSGGGEAGPLASGEHVWVPSWRARPGMCEPQIKVYVSLWIEQTQAMARARTRGGTEIELSMAYALEQAARLVSLRLAGFVLMAPSMSSSGHLEADKGCT